MPSSTYAKDTHVDPYNTAVNGVLDTKPYDRLPERSWLFRSVGYAMTTVLERYCKRAALLAMIMC